MNPESEAFKWRETHLKQSPEDSFLSSLSTMVLKLYGFPMSTCTRRVAIVCKEKNIPYEFILVDLMKGAQKEPEYMAKHPFGQVPCIDDDGFILYESRAICRYLELKYKNQGTKLIPDGLQAQAKFEEAASTEVSNFDVFASAIAIEKLFKP